MGLWIIVNSIRNTFAQKKLKKTIRLAEEILRSPSITSLLNASNTLKISTECANLIKALQSLTAITKASPDQKDTLNTLEQLLMNLQQELEQKAPQDAEALQALLGQAPFAPLPNLVGNLALSPFTMSDCS